MPDTTAPAKRRLIACCDGTWNKPDSYGGSTNIIKLVRVIKTSSASGQSQIVYYHPGVGTGNVVDRWIGGGTGVGLSENVRSTYAFFVDNYQDGDEIFLFGFSRGAYTARSVAGMIGHVGIVRKKHMHNFDPLWDYYRLPSAVREREQAAFLAHFPDRVPANQVSIRCIGVWDTVGSLGIPDSRFCQNQFSFHDTGLGPGVEHAYHALAIDEERRPFQPAIWSAHPSPRVTQTLEQAWFAGVHSNIGGGYREHVLSDAAFFWMCAKIEPLLDLDNEQICAQADRTRAYATGELVNSRAGIWSRFPGSPRKICETDPSERIHQSVWMRFENTNGKPTPDPYRNEQFRALLAKNKSRMQPLSRYEQDILRGIPAAQPLETLDRKHQSKSFCDRIVGWLGGA